MSLVLSLHLKMNKFCSGMRRWEVEGRTLGSRWTRGPLEGADHRLQVRERRDSELSDSPQKKFEDQEVLFSGKVVTKPLKPWLSP